MGDRHLVTIPRGVVGDRLPWGGERQGGGKGSWGGLTLSVFGRGVLGALRGGGFSPKVDYITGYRLPFLVAEKWASPSDKAMHILYIHDKVW